MHVCYACGLTVETHGRVGDDVFLGTFDRHLPTLGPPALAQMSLYLSAIAAKLLLEIAE